MRAVGLVCGVAGMLAACISTPSFVGEIDGSPTDATDAADTRQGASQLTFTNPTSGALVEVPLLIRLDDNCIDYSISPQGTDIRFRYGGAELPHEVERWDPGGESIVWVKLPTVAADAAGVIELVYGAGINTEPKASAVWSEYEAVYHLGSTGDTEVSSTLDSSSGTATGIESVEGIAGRGRRFRTGSANQIAFVGTDTLFSGWSTMTLEIWFHPEYGTVLDLPMTVQSGHTYLGKSNNTAIGNFVFYNESGEFAANKQVFPGGRPFEMRSNSEFTTLAWNYIALAFTGDNNDSTQTSFYTDGALDIRQPGLPASDATLEAGSAQFFIGNPNAAGVAAIIDEVRISQRQFGDEYIAFQYAAINNRGFVTCTPMN